jgi:hypothetical protein
MKKKFQTIALNAAASKTLPIRIKVARNETTNKRINDTT